MKGGAPQGQEPDNSLAPLWITIGVFILGGFIWYFFKAYIVEFVMIIRDAEIDALNFLLPNFMTESLNHSRAMIDAAKSSGYANVSFTDLMHLSNQVGSYLRYPIAVILMGFAVWLYIKKATSRFKQTYDMQKLLVAEYNNWPQIVPVVNLDLVNQDINKGPWAMADSPMMFSKKHDLIIADTYLPKDAGLKHKAISIASIKREEARSVFSMQLGRYWSGVEALPIHIKALFAAFAARINSDKPAADKLLLQIAGSANSGRLNFANVEELVKKYKDTKPVVKICEKHAYIFTAMASMLEKAREDGVLASADFLWLKPLDRRLWFTLNSVGRQTPFTEVAGIFAHWRAEKEFGRKITLPMIEEAVNGLEKAMKELIYIPDESQ